ncbi:MAG: carbohydrate ABC transporter permease [Acidimicrobiales bacterium]
MTDLIPRDETTPDRSESEARRSIGRTPDGRNRGAVGAAKRLFRNILIALPLILLVLWTVAPFVVTLSVSLKGKAEVFSNPSLLPESPNLDAYGDVLASESFTTSFTNSVIVGVGTTFLTIVVAVPAAYAFARFRFRGRHLLLLFTLLPRLVPTIGMMIPIYRLAIETNMLDRRITLIVVYTSMLLPLAVWLLVGFFQAIPRDIEEAANVDGAGLWGRLRYIVLPLAAPAMITVGVLAFREAWNEFTLVLVLVNSPGNRTLPFELYKLQGVEGIADYPLEAAFTVLTILPFIVFYTFVEKHVVAGLITGSGK